MVLGPYSWLIFILLLVSMAVQAYLSNTYGRFGQMRNSRNLTGAQVARLMLDDHGLQNVRVEVIPGALTDHYDPIQKIVRLSENNYALPSVSAAAVAAHEVGHAVQDKVHLPVLALRGRLLPALNLGINIGPWLVLGGFLLRFSGLIWVGVIFFAFAVLFHLITLPVEFDASRRGLDYLGRRGLLTAGEVPGARSVLTAAALTYIAGFAIALAQLLSFIGLARNSR